MVPSKTVRSYLQREIYGLEFELSAEIITHYSRLVLMIAAGDGVVSEAEWAYAEGRAMAIGIPQAALEQLRGFDYKGANLAEEAAAYRDASGSRGAYAFLYDAIKVASVDGYAAGEQAAVRRVANILGIPLSTVESIEHLIQTEDALRELRLSVLYPQRTVFHRQSS